MSSSWELRPVSSLGVFVNGYPFKPDDHGSDGLPIVRIRQLNDPDADVDYYDGFVPMKNRIDSGDLIFSWSGSLCVEVWDRGPAYLNQHLFKVLAGDQIDQGWLRWALTYSLEFFDPYMHGSAMTHITQPMMRQVRVPVAPLIEQQRIGAFLDDQVALLDAAVRARSRQLLVLSEAREALSEVALRGTEQAVPMSRRGPDWLGEAPSHWRRARVGSLFRRVKDVGHPDEQMLSVFRDFGVVAKDSRANLNVTADDRNIYQLVHPGWFVVNRMKAWQGSVGISPLTGIVSGHYLCFEPRHSESDAYLNLLLRSASYRAAYASLSRGVRPGQAEIDNDWLAQLPVVLPPLPEQRQIVEFVTGRMKSAEALAEAVRTSLKVLGERRRSLIAAAITGQLDPATMSDRAGKVAIA